MAKKYYCENCDYKCFKKYNCAKHLTTPKHLSATHGNTINGKNGKNGKKKYIAVKIAIKNTTTEVFYL